MDRKERREIDRAIKKLARRGSTRCNICRRPYEHGEHTFTGQSMSHQWRMVGACCRDKLVAVDISGMYFHWDKPFEPALAQMGRHPSRQHLTSSADTEYMFANADVVVVEGDDNADRDH